MVLLLGASVLTPAAAHAADAAEQLQEVVVTGSRITRAGFSAPTPVSTVTTEDLAKQGVTNVATYLTNLPSFVPTNSPQGTGNNGTGSGANFLNLRGLGAQRTLVLVNGERHVATNAAGVVDLNVIPSIALERVDVVTGGASAAWGSNAVSGVVNLITADKMQGLKAEAQAGVSKYGDSKDYRVGVAGGTSFADGRGHIMLSAEYQRNEGIPTPNGRKWAEAGWAQLNNVNAAVAGQAAAIIRPNVQQSTSTINGLIRTGVLAGNEFVLGGTVKPFQYGTLNNGSYMVGGGGQNIVDVMGVPYDRKTLYMATSYDVTDNLELYFRGFYGRAEATNPIQPNYANSVTIRSDNAYLSAEAKARLAAANETSFTMGRIFYDMPLVTNYNNGDSYDITLGLKGKLGKTWTWNAAYKSGSTTLTQRQTTDLITPNLTAALDAVVNPANGQIVCRSSIAGQPQVAGATTGCVPINIFGAGAPTAAAIGYVTGTAFATVNIDQYSFAGSAQGEVFDLPAGAISIVVGGEYRNEKVANSADPLSDKGGAFLFPYAASFGGESTVKEVFGEAVVPLLKDMAFAQSLDLNGAVRYTDYDLAGNVTTWKYGATWKPVSSVLLRATSSRDIRAPSLTELFTAASTSFTQIIDPCLTASQAANATVRANCAAAGVPATFAGTTGVVTIKSGGNKDLIPETAKTYTAGIVFSPAGDWGALNVSVDWYSIDIKDRIGTINTATLLTNCYTTGVGCQAITRGPDSQISLLSVQQMNIATSKQKGFDFEAGYSVQAANLGLPLGGRIEARLYGTYIYDIKLSSDGVTVRDLTGGVGQGDGGAPKWKFNANLSYAEGPLTLFTQMRYTGGGFAYYRPSENKIDDPTVKSLTLFDASAAYKFEVAGARMEGFGGINNLFNTDPPRAVKSGTIPLYTNAGLYEMIGRYFYAGLRMKF
ncbi:TonB-dependent receptor [Phenylobacterium sp.]|uniref:TonB-dependent receptor domain-containing protein n=1 Tax=Phenylobacterium sp. TaxID=1871053 RepID=UPI0025D954E9|nr:TonB-dependent receptor [Phenylobacterium sp.]